ncbi:MAG TPA: DUF6544 family protein [Bryobacteraceae bacterium]|nr:DUF6544 family protein [Bryobacteraceae bacterium]
MSPVAPLPDPVRRYLRLAVPENAAEIRTVHLRHDGFFRPNPGPRWFPIQGEQSFTLEPPGFVWRARIRMLPLLWIEARDSLASGRGGMRIRFNSIFTITDASGPEIDQGARARWLAEAVWFPQAFAGDRIRWEPIDDRSARATLPDEGLPVSLVVEFDAEGRPARVRGERYRTVEGGKAVLTPWSGTCTDYRDFAGLLVPSRVEAIWDLDAGPFSYARFHVTELRYNSDTTPAPSP